MHETNNRQPKELMVTLRSKVHTKVPECVQSLVFRELMSHRSQWKVTMANMESSQDQIRHKTGKAMELTSGAATD